jgi:hypothetical protein
MALGDVLAPFRFSERRNIVQLSAQVKHPDDNAEQFAPPAAHRRM